MVILLAQKLLQIYEIIICVQKMRLNECYVLPITLVLCLLLELFGITLFANTSMGLLLFITHILSALTVGIILGIISKFKIWSDKNKFENNNFFKTNTTSPKKIATFSNLGAILSEAILESSKTIIMIGGFVVIFSVIISILNTSGLLELLSYILYPVLKSLNIDISFAKSIISGIIELTNGVSTVAGIASKSISTNIILCAFLLGFGGLSVLLQVLSIISKSDLSIKKYFFGKLLQGIIAALYTYILITLIPMLSLNL